jgi:uncharacterized protein (DUF2147 family)
MLRSLFLAAAALGMATPTLAAPTAITGRWATDDGNAIVEIYPCGAKLCGRILRLLITEPAGGQRDERNPDKSMRDRQLQGLKIYWDLEADGNGWKGQGYSPEDGRYYKANLHPTGNRMNMKGCVAIFCRTVTWTRAK